MLTNTGAQPGLLGAVLIALAGGWAASRVLRDAQDGFGSLILGLTGAVLGLMLAGVAGVGLGPVGLLAASLGFGLLILALARSLSIAAERRRNRNHKLPREFESGGSTGNAEGPPK